MASRNAHWLAGVLSATAIALGGCVMGPTNNNQNSSNATNVTKQSLEVRWGLSLGVGDAVTKAAAETIKGIMSPASGLAAALTPEKKEEAVKAVVQAGVAQAQKEGGDVNVEKITGAARDAVDAAAKKEAAADAAPATNP